MHMGKKKPQISFEEYYSNIFKDRWPSLKDALLSSSYSVAFERGLKKPYYMNIASVAVASIMPYCKKGMLLDMCAAPGGKTLVLATMMEKSVFVQANELSDVRRIRLNSVLSEYLSDDLKTNNGLQRVWASGYDAAGMARYYRDKYDRILLDAPCSSERHVLQSPKDLKKWTPARIKTLSIRQWALLSSAFLMLKYGGILIYSTCALLDAENDCVIDKLLAKYKNARILHIEVNKEFRFVTSVLSPPIEMRHGYAYLPDVHNGAGPMYFCIIGKE